MTNQELIYKLKDNGFEGPDELDCGVWGFYKKGMCFYISWNISRDNNVIDFCEACYTGLVDFEPAGCFGITPQECWDWFESYKPVRIEKPEPVKVQITFDVGSDVVENTMRYVKKALNSPGVSNVKIK